jgi:signal transduction histidine kinase
MISIRDQGVGISPEVLSKIFDPYFSSKETVTQKGMGLGLSICYSIIEDHKGRIEVDSEIGTGTTFKIYLPASER